MFVITGFNKSLFKINNEHNLYKDSSIYDANVVIFSSVYLVFTVLPKLRFKKLWPHLIL